MSRLAVRKGGEELPNRGGTLLNFWEGRVPEWPRMEFASSSCRLFADLSTTIEIAHFAI